VSPVYKKSTNEKMEMELKLQSTEIRAAVKGVCVALLKKWGG
jgi:hypothetical protein